MRGDAGRSTGARSASRKHVRAKRARGERIYPCGQANWPRSTGTCGRSNPPPAKMRTGTAAAEFCQRRRGLICADLTNEKCFAPVTVVQPHSRVDDVQAGVASVALVSLGLAL